MNLIRSGWRQGIVAATLLLVAGCSFGPMTICSNRQRYNEAVRETWNEQFLLNMLRLRYHEPPQFDVVSNILASHSFDAAINGRQELRSGFMGAPKGTTSVNGSIFDLLVYGASAGISERPTITYSPLEGAEFTKLLLGQVHLESLVLLSRTGWDIDRIMRLSVQKIDGIENVTQTCGTPEPMPVYQEFALLARHLRALQIRGDMELSFDELDRPVSSVNVKDEKITIQTMMSAAQQKFDLHTDTDKTTTLWTKERGQVLRIAPQAWGNGPEAVEAARMLKLTPQAPQYRLISAAEHGHLKQNADPNDIYVSTRSTLGLLIFAAKGIEIPRKHYEKGLVSDPVDEFGNMFDWSCVMKDLITVKSQCTRPLHAFVRVHYRGHWFYIDDADLASKATFALIIELYGLELAGGVVPGPVVTVPVGNGLSAVPAGGGGGGGGKGKGGG